MAFEHDALDSPPWSFIEVIDESPVDGALDLAAVADALVGCLAELEAAAARTAKRAQSLTRPPLDQLRAAADLAPA